jgi:hypothetical protein
MGSNMQRTITEQKKLGRVCGIVERFCHNRKTQPGHRSDLYNIFDVLAMHPRQGIIGIQCCGLDFSAHYRKITEEYADNALCWLASGRGRTHIEIWSWRKILKKRGGKLRIWSPRIKRISYNDLKGYYRADADTEAA